MKTRIILSLMLGSVLLGPMVPEAQAAKWWVYRWWDYFFVDHDNRGDSEKLYLTITTPEGHNYVNGTLKKVETGETTQIEEEIWFAAGERKIKVAVDRPVGFENATIHVSLVEHAEWKTYTGTGLIDNDDNRVTINLKKEKPEPRDS